MPQTAAAFAQPSSATALASHVRSSDAGGWCAPDETSEAALAFSTVHDERPKKKLRCRILPDAADSSTCSSNTSTGKRNDATAVRFVDPCVSDTSRSFTVTAGPAAATLSSSSSVSVSRGVATPPLERFAAILGQWWARMVRSFAAFARPGTPPFLIHDAPQWRAHVLQHPCVYAGLDNSRPFLLDRCLGSDMPRWTAHLRGAASAFGDAGVGPDPTGLFHHFLARAEANSYIEPAAWLIVFALVDKLYLEHFAIFNTLASAPHTTGSSPQLVRVAGVAAFGARFYAGHTLRNLFVLFAMAHKWHGDSYFTLKYFQELLPRGLRRSSCLPSSSSSAAAASSGAGLVASTRHLSTNQLVASQRHEAVEPVELAGIEEAFLRLLDHNLSIAPQSILRLADYFLTPDEKEFVAGHVAKSSIQKKWTSVLL